MPVSRVIVLVGIPVALRLIGSHLAGHPQGAILPSNGSVRINSAPRARRIAMRSGLAFAGSARVTSTPSAAPSVA